jgi:hypothetical protein
MEGIAMMGTATALLIAMPLLPLAMPERVKRVAGIWVMMTCWLGGAAFAFGY